MPEGPWVQVASALLRSEQAVKFDNGGDYKSAINCYRDAIFHLNEEVLSSVSEDEREKLYEMITQYNSRVEILVGAMPELTQAAPVTNLPGAFDFEESPPSGSPPDPPPTSLANRPYWLMRVLCQTMVRGGYMTQRLYVPPAVWFQEGARLTAIETKYSSCQTILIYLQKLKSEETSDEIILGKELDEFCGQLNLVQNALARKLTFINEIVVDVDRTSSVSNLLSRVGNNITKGVERLQANIIRLRINDDTAYIELLIKIFETVPFLEAWLNKFEAIDSKSYISDRLRYISTFFYNVLCAFVMQDFDALLQRYLRKTRQMYISPV